MKKLINDSDPHHCNCFFMSPLSIQDFYIILKQMRFTEQVVEEPRGQIIGLAKDIDENNRIHIKIMGEGNIEAEIEPPLKYPLEHLDSKYCYSAHYELQNILRYMDFIYYIKNNIPQSCINRKIVKPDHPIHINTIIIGGLILGMAYYLSRKYLKKK